MAVLCGGRVDPGAYLCFLGEVDLGDAERRFHVAADDNGSRIAANTVEAAAPCPLAVPVIRATLPCMLTGPPWVVIGRLSG